jgi:hypothetical protein
MAYTPEMLAALSDVDLDDVVEEMILGKEPEPGLLPRVRRGWIWRATESDGHSSSDAGVGRIMAAMLEKGFTMAVAPGGVVWVAGAGREIKYVGGGSLVMARAVAIAAILAVQGG